MASIKLDHVFFHYETPFNDVFNDLSLLLDTTWRTGLIGRNGMGKSTLMNLIVGNLKPVSGDVEIAVDTVYFPAPVDEKRSTRLVLKDAVGPFRAWEQAMAECLEDGSEAALDRYADIQEQYQLAGGYELDSAINEELALVGLEETLLDRPFPTLSGGEQTRVLIAALFARPDAFPLIDEPTNHLDVEGREQLATYLASKEGFILVSHDRHFLNAAIDHVVSINKNDIQICQGNYATWKKHMDEVGLHEQRTRENIEREVKQLKRAAQQRRQGADSKEREKYSSSPDKGGPAMLDKGRIGHLAAKQMKRALSVERRIGAQLAEKAGLLKNQEKARELVIRTADAGRERLLSVQNVSHSYDGRPILQHVDFVLNRGDRIAVVGPNGSGKSTLLNIIASECVPDEGLVHFGPTSRFSRAYQVPLWRSGVLRDYLHQEGMDETRFRQVLGSFGVRGDVFERPLETFSQGQLKKVDLARSMLVDADFLLWDEPMNYIDVFSREQIEVAIEASGPTMIFVEHDQAFIEQVATDVIRL